MTGKYDDIIHMSRHVSSTRKGMSIHDRAAQFSPFAALTGYEDALEETARVTGKRIEMDDHEKCRMDLRYRHLMQHISQSPEVIVTYFLPDMCKLGGSYVTISGHLKNIRAGFMFLTDGTVIDMQDVICLESALLDNEMDERPEH